MPAKPAFKPDFIKLNQREINNLLTLTNANFATICREIDIYSSVLSAVTSGYIFFSSLTFFKLYSSRWTIDYKFVLPDRITNKRYLNQKETIVTDRFAKSKNTIFKNRDQLYLNRSLTAEQIPQWYIVEKTLEIKFLIQALELSVQEFAHAIQVKESIINSYLNHKRCPSSTFFANLYEYLGIGYTFYSKNPIQDTEEKAIDNIDSEKELEDTKENKDPSLSNPSINSIEDSQSNVLTQPSTPPVELPKPEVSLSNRQKFRSDLIDLAKEKTEAVFGPRFSEETFFKVLDYLSS